MKPGKRLATRLLFSLLSLAVLWSLSIFTISMVYIQHLLHPGCAHSQPESAGFQSISLQTSDSLRLQGWWHAPENGVAVILLGGLGASRDSMLPEAQMLAGRGFGALTIDYRSCAGRLATLGPREIRELQAMLDFVQAQPGVLHIAALGFSVGGTVVLLGGAQMPQIEALIAEGNYANLKDEITTAQSVPLSLRWQIQQGVLLTYWLSTGIAPRTVSPIDSIPYIAPRPILFIHGEDEMVRTQAEAQFDAAENAMLWIVPGAAHGKYRQVHPEEYDEKIIDFLQSSFAD